MTTALLVASPNAVIGFPAAMERLRDGGRVLDAVEIAVRAVKDNLEGGIAHRNMNVYQ